MFKSKFLAVIAALAIASVASAASIGFSQANYVFTKGVSANSQPLSIVAVGNDTIVGTDVVVALGDAGADLGGTNTAPPFPAITDLSIAGSAGNAVFPAGDAGNQSALVILSGGLAATRSNTSVGTGAAANRTANGTLAVVTIDISQAALGTYPIALSIPALGVGTDTIAPSGALVDNVLTGATITIQAIPEPASALLLLGALPFLRRRTA